jgi:hypothetical protein
MAGRMGLAGSQAKGGLFGDCLRSGDRFQVSGSSEGRWYLDECLWIVVVSVPWWRGSLVAVATILWWHSMITWFSKTSSMCDWTRGFVAEG